MTKEEILTKEIDLFEILGVYDSFRICKFII